MSTPKRLRVCDGSTIFEADSPTLLPSAAPANLPNNPNKSLRLSPEALIAPTPPPIAGFLDTCHYCGKKIPPSSEIFMYRDFCAFCSKECRENQIKCNGHPEEQSILPKSSQQKKNRK